MGVLQRNDAIMIASEVYRGSVYAPTHPLRIPRVPVLLDLARALDILPVDRFRVSPKAKPAALTSFHTATYISALQRAEETGAVPPEVGARHHLGTLSNPIFPQVYSRPATGVGAVLLACEILAGRPSGRIHAPGGGTHHGMKDRANGFCYLNDVALAVPLLRSAGLARIAYVDIDAHHCDGVEEALLGQMDTRLYSVHEKDRWPGTGATGRRGNTLNMAVPRGLNDNEMHHLVRSVIVPDLAAFQPEIILLQAGADSLDEDPLSRLSLSNRAYLDTLDALLPLAPRFLLLGGGGYNPWSVGRCWTALWARLSGQEVPSHLPPAAEGVLRKLSWMGGGRPLPPEHLFTTLLDPPRPGPIRDEIIATALLCQKAKM